MYFIDEKHEENFKELMNVFGLVSDDYRASIYITAHPNIFRLIKIENIDIGAGSPIFCLFEEGENKFAPSHPGLTGGTMRLCEFAASIFNDYEVSMDEVLSSLDRPSKMAVLEAVKIRAGLEYDFKNYGNCKSHG